MNKLEELEAKETRLYEGYQATKLEHETPINEALNAWSEAFRAVKREKEIEAIRAEVRAELREEFRKEMTKDAGASLQQQAAQ